jgi:hypothetical protein|tara:strand:+ start:238 stop:480 length:243 start_codon:yes stop_codon:yes gene_type:complete
MNLSGEPIDFAELKRKQPRILPGDLVCTEDFPEVLGLVVMSSPGTSKDKSVCKIKWGELDHTVLFREQELILFSGGDYEN